MRNCRKSGPPKVGPPLPASKMQFFNKDLKGNVTVRDRLFFSILWPGGPPRRPRAWKFAIVTKRARLLLTVAQSQPTRAQLSSKAGPPRRQLREAVPPRAVLPSKAQRPSAPWAALATVAHQRAPTAQLYVAHQRPANAQLYVAPGAAQRRRNSRAPESAPGNPLAFRGPLPTRRQKPWRWGESCIAPNKKNPKP